MDENQRLLRLSNGFELHLSHQPGASQGAALLQVKAGSYDEPARWSGLAHLLEHLLFSGGEQFPGQQRLMPWVQSLGGQVNATTLAYRTAYFWQVPANSLRDGMARLKDMVLHPQLTAAAIAQESRVIDAEYRLLQQHLPALTEAALLHSIENPACFRDFHVGSLACFGEDTALLRQALLAFHAHYYISQNAQLRLSGPQSLDELEELARQFVAGWPEGTARAAEPLPQLVAAPHAQLKQNGPQQLWISWLMQRSDDAVRDAVTLLREFALDAAPGSLLAQLREQGFCHEISFHWLSTGDNSCWPAVKFITDTPDPLLAAWQQWLAQVAETSPQQQAHYQQLALRRFHHLTPLEKVRQQTLGFAPESAIPHLEQLLPLLNESVCLWVSPDAPTQTCMTQGYTLSRSSWTLPAMSPEARWKFTFYPQPLPEPAPAVLADGAGLLHLKPDSWPATLLLRPAWHCSPDAARGRALAGQLGGSFAWLRHLGGEAEWAEVQGIWQFTLQLPANHSAAQWLMEHIADALVSTSPAHPVPPESIALRQLLAALPGVLLASTGSGQWQGALLGGDRTLAQQLAARMAVLPPLAAIEKARPARQMQPIAHPGNENALLLFIPLLDATPASLLALQVLARCYEPLFFQRLRIELQVGYAVTCRYLRCGDRDGVLLAAQSPDVPIATLLAEFKAFMRNMTAQIAQLTQEDIQQHVQRLLHEAQGQNIATTLQRNLRREAGLAELPEETNTQLTAVDLLALHQQLLSQRRQWRMLFSSGKQ